MFQNFFWLLLLKILDEDKVLNLTESKFNKQFFPVRIRYNAVPRFSCLFCFRVSPNKKFVSKDFVTFLYSEACKMKAIEQKNETLQQL